MHIDQVLLSVFGDLSGLQTKYQSKTTMVHYAFEIEEKLDYYPMHLLLSGWWDQCGLGILSVSIYYIVLLSVLPWIRVEIQMHSDHAIQSPNNRKSTIVLSHSHVYLRFTRTCLDKVYHRRTSKDPSLGINYVCPGVPLIRSGSSL